MTVDEKLNLVLENQTIISCKLDQLLSCPCETNSSCPAISVLETAAGALAAAGNVINVTNTATCSEDDSHGNSKIEEEETKEVSE